MTTYLRCPICGGTERSLLPESVCDECGCGMKPVADAEIALNKDASRDDRIAAMRRLGAAPAPAVDGGDADDVPTVTLDDDARYRIARALCDDNAARTGNYADDVWKLYSDDFYSDADIVIAAILDGRSHG